MKIEQRFSIRKHGLSIAQSEMMKFRTHLKRKILKRNFISIIFPVYGHA